MNLDGETNLKDRELALTTINEDQIGNFTGIIECFEPSANLEYWEANLLLKGNEQVKNCDIKNLLLRGCTLKNTEFATGICCYAGAETKIFMNSKKPERKVSRVMKMMNTLLLSVFAL